MAKCSGWCTPLYIYLVLAVMMFITTLRMHFQNPDVINTESVVMSVLYKIFWAGVIYLLCSSCHENWAWVMLLIPLIYIVLVLLMLFMLVGGMAAGSVAVNQVRN